MCGALVVLPGRLASGHLSATGLVSAGVCCTARLRPLQNPQMWMQFKA
ncbi:hypothetical protein HMPREF9371_2309 [Neisseria shayeganii 871]|uniref:Uncharacterized protein n=1 Tax=Neisseria shayeganii 871 TaxID=1032488 RepID=G4CL18_9NEIS|nr:hypothetical protein HMPREF9371_2309 [Neisseria shayeganii 871]